MHVQRSYVFCSSVTITPGFTELTRTFFGASSNATHLQSVARGKEYLHMWNAFFVCPPGHLVQSSLGDIVRQHSATEIILSLKATRPMFIYIWTSLPRKGADPVDAGHIDDISLGFLEVGHGQHCQVQHCPDVGGHHPEGGDVNDSILMKLNVTQAEIGPEDFLPQCTAAQGAKRQQ